MKMVGAVAVAALPVLAAFADVTRYEGDTGVASWNTRVKSGLTVAEGEAVELANGTFSIPVNKAPTFNAGSSLTVESGALLNYSVPATNTFYINKSNAKIVLDGGKIQNNVYNKTAFFGSSAKDSRIELKNGAVWNMPKSSWGYFNIAGTRDVLSVESGSTLQMTHTSVPHRARGMKFIKAKNCLLSVSNATLNANMLCFGNYSLYDQYNSGYYKDSLNAFAVCNTALLHNATCNFYDDGNNRYGLIMGRDCTNQVVSGKNYYQPNCSTNNIVIVSGDDSHTTTLPSVHLHGYCDTFRVEGTKMVVTHSMTMKGMSNRFEVVGGSFAPSAISLGGTDNVLYFGAGAGSSVEVASTITATNTATIEVASGRVKFTKSLPIQPNIIVRSGATLELTQTNWSSLKLTIEDGGNLIAPTAVEYDPATGTTTPVALPIVPANGSQFKLSQAIGLPLHDGAKLKIATFDASVDRDPSTFVDATTKNCGLPRTHFTIEEEEGGGKALYLVANKTVVSVKALEYEDKSYLNGNTNTWSNGKVAQAGYDYLINGHTVGDVGPNVFQGDSLTIKGSQEIKLRSETCKFVTRTGEPVTIYPGPKLYPNYSGGRNINITGDIYLPGDYGSTDYVFLRAKYRSYKISTKDSTNGTLRLSANLTGSGTLCVTANYENLKAISGLAGASSNYTGQVKIYGHGSSFSNSMRVRIYEQQNLGGLLPTFQSSALYMTQNALLRPMNDLTLLDDVNRGMYVVTGGIECVEGVTMKTYWPLKVTHTFGKEGEGTLWLGGKLTLSGSVKALRVNAGTIGALNDAAVNGFNAVFSNNTTIAISADAGLVNGFTGTLTVTNDVEGVAGKVRVMVDPDTLPAKLTPLKLPICTIPQSQDLPTDAFAPVRPKGYAKPVIVREAVTLNNVECYRYYLTAVPSGMVMYVQ